MGTGSFLGGKERPGRDADPSLPSSAVGHERVELYLYSPLWAVRPVQSLSACTRVTFTRVALHDLLHGCLHFEEISCHKLCGLALTER